MKNRIIRWLGGWTDYDLTSFGNYLLKRDMTKLYDTEDDIDVIIAKCHNVRHADFERWKEIRQRKRR